MSRRRMAAGLTPAAIAIALAGCSQANWSPSSAGGGHGRYVGVGLYSPSKQWTRMVMAGQLADAASAKPIDDQVIIVVTDCVTGELRACGDLTGYCVGMNPWKNSLSATQVAPIKMTSHVEADAESPPVVGSAPPAEPAAKK